MLFKYVESAIECDNHALHNIMTWSELDNG